MFVISTSGRPAQFFSLGRHLAIHVKRCSTCRRPAGRSENSPRRARRRVRSWPAPGASRGDSRHKHWREVMEMPNPDRVSLCGLRHLQSSVPRRSLFIPQVRDRAKDLGKPQPLRLPPVEDRLDDVRRQETRRKQPADIGVRDALLLRKVGDRPRLPALDPAPPAVRSHERLDQGLVAARLWRRCRRALRRPDQLPHRRGAGVERQPPCPVPTTKLAGLLAAAAEVWSVQSAPS